MMVSAICTVLSAAPLRRLSETTQKRQAVVERLVLADAADIGGVIADAFDRRHVAAGLALIDHEHAGRLAQDLARLRRGDRVLELDIDGFGMADKDRHAHASRGELDLGIEDLLGLGHHLPFLLGRAVFHEDVDMRNDVEGDLLGELAWARRMW